MFCWYVVKGEGVIGYIVPEWVKLLGYIVSEWVKLVGYIVPEWVKLLCHSVQEEVLLAWQQHRPHHQYIQQLFKPSLS